MRVFYGSWAVSSTQCDERALEPLMQGDLASGKCEARSQSLSRVARNCPSFDPPSSIAGFVPRRGPSDSLGRFLGAGEVLYSKASRFHSAYSIAEYSCKNRPNSGSVKKTFRVLYPAQLHSLSTHLFIVMETISGILKNRTGISLSPNPLLTIISVPPFDDRYVPLVYFGSQP